MIDPLIDPRAEALLAARPGDIDQIAATLRDVSQIAVDSADGLQGAQNDLTWDGEAATAFRTTLGKAPAELQLIHQSYADAARTVQTYADAVSPLQTQFRSLSTQLSSGREQAEALRTQLAELNMQIAERTPELNATNPGLAQLLRTGAPLTFVELERLMALIHRVSGELHALQAAYAALLNRLTAIHEGNAGLESQALRILGEFDGQRTTVSGALQAAAELAPRRPPWFERALGQGGATGTTVSVATGLENLGAAVTDLPSELDAFVEDPTMSSLEKALGGLAAVAALTLLAAGITTGSVALLKSLVSTEANALLGETGARAADANVDQAVDAGVQQAAGEYGEGSGPASFSQLSAAQRRSLAAAFKFDAHEYTGLSSQARTDFLASIDAAANSVTAGASH